MEGQRVSKKPASSAYADVFGGPPRFAASPFPARLDDYVEIFGGSASSCSIPFLDLPPATDGLDGEPPGFRNGHGFDYSEVFGGLEFGGFAVSYEELFSSSRGLEVGSTKRRDFEDPAINGQATKESELSLENVKTFHTNCIEDDHDCCPLNCNHSDQDSEQSNRSNNRKNPGSNDGAARGKSLKTDPPRTSSTLECAGHLQTQKPGASISNTNGADLNTSGDEAIPVIREFSSQCSASELNHVDLTLHSPSSISNSVTSDDLASSNAMYVSVVDISLRTQPLQVPPPTRPPPKVCNKSKQPFLKTGLNMKINLDGQSSSEPNEYPEYGVVSKSYAPRVGVKDGPSSLDVEIDASTAAAAMQKAMEQAEARLRCAKEMMERKHVNYHNRKKFGHHERKYEHEIAQSPFLVDSTSVITRQKNLAKDNETVDDIASDGSKLTNVFKASLSAGESTRHVTMSKHSQEMMKENSLAPEKESMDWRMDREHSKIEREKWSVIVENVHEQEAIRKKIKGPTCIDEDGHYANKDVALSSEFKSNNSLKEDKEWIDERKNAINVKDDHDSCKEEAAEVADNVVFMALQLQESFNILKDTHISCNGENKKLEEVQNVHGENLSIPFSVEKVSVSVRIEENLETENHEFEGTYDCKEGANESKDAKAHYEFVDDLHDIEAIQVTLSETLNLESDQVTFESEKNKKDFTVDAINSEQIKDDAVLDVSVIAAVPHDKKMRMAFESGMFEVGNELDALCESSDHSNNHVQMDRNTMETQKEARDEPCSKKESSMPGKYETRLVVDQDTDEIGNDSMKQKATKVMLYDESKNAKADGTCAHDCNELKANGLPGEETRNVIQEPCFLEKSEKQTTPKGNKEIRENGKNGEIHANPHVLEEQVDGGHSNNLAQMDGNTVETLKEAREEPCSKKESSMSQKYKSGLVVDEDTDEIAGNSMKRKGTGVMPYEEHNNAKAGGACSQDCNELRGNELPGEDQKYDEMPQAVHEPCLLEKSKKQTMLQGDKEVSRNEKIGRILANPANPDVSANTDILNIDSDARGSLLFKYLDAQPENGDDMLELQSAKDAAYIGNVGSSKFTSNFKKTEDNESGRMEKERKSSENMTRKLEQVVELQSAKDAADIDNVGSSKFTSNFKKTEDNESGRMEKERKSSENLTRKLEEVVGREREREREKDRAEVERAIHEVHERANTKARERAERIAVERVTAEARQRALKEAQEKADKASVLAAEKSVANHALKEARLKAERASVEQAIAEARGRAAERALAEKAAGNDRERKERPNVFYKDRMSKENGMVENSKALNKDDSTGAQFHSTGSSNNSKGYSSLDSQSDSVSTLRYRARFERHQRTAERVAKALAEKNMRDVLAQREQAERNRLAEYLDPDVKRWSNGKEGNLRALLSTLQYVLGPESGWQPISLTDVITATAVKKAYRKATLHVHPDKLQQRGASIRQKYICEKVFDLLKEAWNKFNSEER